MAALSRLGRQTEELVGALNRLGVRFALIGGLALTPHKVIRATQDIDMLTDAISADDIDQELLRLGYRCIHRSAEAGNYLRGDERVEIFLYPPIGPPHATCSPARRSSRRRSVFCGSSVPKD